MWKFALRIWFYSTLDALFGIRDNAFVFFMGMLAGSCVVGVLSFIFL